MSAEKYYLFSHGNFYERHPLFPGVIVSNNPTPYSSQDAALEFLQECRLLLSKNSLAFSPEYVDEQSLILDTIEVIPATDIRLANMILEFEAVTA